MDGCIVPTMFNFMPKKERDQSSSCLHCLFILQLSRAFSSPVRTLEALSVLSLADLPYTYMSRYVPSKTPFSAIYLRCLLTFGLYFVDNLANLRLILSQ